MNNRREGDLSNIPGRVDTTIYIPLWQLQRPDRFPNSPLPGAQRRGSTHSVISAVAYPREFLHTKSRGSLDAVQYAILHRY